MPGPAGVLSSDINLNLYSITRVTSNEPNLINELQDILNAFRILQQELTSLRARVKALEPVVP